MPSKPPFQVRVTCMLFNLRLIYCLRPWLLRALPCCCRCGLGSRQRERQSPRRHPSNAGRLLLQPQRGLAARGAPGLHHAALGNVRAGFGAGCLGLVQRAAGHLPLFDCHGAIVVCAARQGRCGFQNGSFLVSRSIDPVAPATFAGIERQRICTRHDGAWAELQPFAPKPQHGLVDAAARQQSGQASAVHGRCAEGRETTTFKIRVSCADHPVAWRAPSQSSFSPLFAATDTLATNMWKHAYVVPSVAARVVATIQTASFSARALGDVNAQIKVWRGPWRAVRWLKTAEDCSSLSRSL